MAMRQEWLNYLNQDKLYIKRAKVVLPYLVRQAKAGEPIYYSDLAREVDIPNPRNLNYVLGAIGNAIEMLNKGKKTQIPPIQCLVLSKSTNLPGEGFDGFLRISNFRKLTKSQKREVISSQLMIINTYSKWDWVLAQLNLEPVSINLAPLIKKACEMGFGGGESEHHRAFKVAIANDPYLIGLETLTGEVEYKLPSGDRLDILFKDNNLLIGVEVKSFISSDADILRGLFQCVKYIAVIEATQKSENQIPNARVILALQNRLPSELMQIKNILGIEVIDNIVI